MELFRILSGPVIGAAIGYITNDIAIRMLFRPHKALYVLGRRLPFTPGIVPRRKNQLAEILGSAIVEKFFNADDLEIIFTTGIAGPVADALVKLLRSEVTPAQIIQDNGAQESFEKLEEELCVRIQAAFCLGGLPETIAREGLGMAARQLGDGAAAQALRSGLGANIEAAMAREIEEFVIEHGREHILPLIRTEAQRLGDAPLSELTAQLAGDSDDALRETLKGLYLRFMSRHVRPIVESIDVGGMITEKIVLMSSEEVEDLVLTVVRRELRLVVLFGAFVGAIIGAVNIFL